MDAYHSDGRADAGRILTGEPMADLPAPPAPRARRGGAVLLVGAQTLAFAALRAILVRNGFGIAGAGRRLRDLEGLARYRTADVLLIVDASESRQAAIDDIGLARQALPQARIVALFDGFAEVTDDLPHGLGANAVLDRTVTAGALIKILDAVLAGYGVLPPVAAGPARGPGPPGAGSWRPQAREAPSADLSEREFDIIACIAEGQSNKLIARRFSISEATVKIHVRGILRKINARNRTQAALWALHRGIGTSSLPVD